MSAIKTRPLNWVILGDTHFGLRSDSKIFHGFQREFFEKQFIPFIRDNNVKTVITLGDLFDRRKFINYETLTLAREVLLDPLRDMGVGVWSIIGNHDAYYKNTNRVNSPELLISGVEYPNVQLFSSPETVTIDGVRVMMMPWINDENYASTVDMVKTTDARFVIAHLEMKGFEYFRGVVSDHGHLDEDMLARFQAVWTGHYHTKSSKGNIHYLGTPYEMNWSDHNDPKGFHHFDGEHLRFIQNDDRIFVRLHYDDSDPSAEKNLLSDRSSYKGKYVKVVVKAKNNPILFERYLNGILETGPVDVNVIDETNKIVETETPDELPSDTMDIIEKFIKENLKTDLSKERILSHIRKIYMLAKETAEDE